MYLLKKDITKTTQTEINNAYKKIKQEKKEKIKRLKNKEARKRSIVGEMLLMEGLRNFYNIHYEQTNFFYNFYGKPYILNEKIYYNISHSNHMVVCVFSDKEIGIDIENVRNTNINTTSIFATDAEKKYIIQNRIEIEKRLFKVYTLKEAYFKMTGKGLSDISNVKKVEFTIDNNIQCNDSSINAQLLDQEDYIIAICEKN